MYYEINVSDELYALAREFSKAGSTLYIVGGYVRDSVLGLKNTDIDICADLKYDAAIDLAKKLGYEAKIVNEKLGTISIKTKHDAYEYVTFRKDNYSKGGAHSPDSVSYVKDIRVDAARRDLAVNAMYYDILSHELLDFYNGLADLKRGVIHSVTPASEVFASDGLRILRLIRFSQALGYKIDAETAAVAKSFVSNLADISKDRIIGELRAIVEQADRYSVPSAIKRSIKLINAWHIMDQIITIGGRKIDYHGIDKVERGNRFAMLLYRIFEPYVSRCNNCEEYYLHNVLGRGGLGVSNNLLDIVSHLVSITHTEPNHWSAYQFKALNTAERDLLRVIDSGLYSKYYDLTRDMESNHISSTIKNPRDTGYYLDRLMYEVLEKNLPNDKKHLESMLQTILLSENV